MSNTMLPPVVAKLMANIDQFKSKMGEARKDMKDTHDAGKSSFSGLGLVVGAGLTVAAGAATALGAASVKAYEDLGSTVGKLQRISGESATSMSKLVFEANETGVSSESLSKVMLRMEKNAAGNSKAFDAAGIATRDASGHMLSMTQILGNASDVFAKMPDGPEKTALAMQLFGRTGADLLPMLNKGSAGLKEMGDEAEKFGVVIGQDGVDAVRKNAKAHREMHEAMEGIKIQIGQYLMPLVAKLTTWLAEHMPAAVAVVKRVMAGLAPVFEGIGRVISWLADWIRKHWDQIKADVEKAVEFVRQVIQTAVTVIEAIWSKFGSNIVDYIEHAWDFVKGIVQAALDVIRGIIQVVTGLIHGDWSKVWEGIKNIFGGVWDAITSIVSFAMDILKNILQVGWKVLVGVVTGAWDLLKSAVSSGIDNVVGFVKGLPKKAVDALASLGQGLYGLATGAMQLLWNGLQDAWNAGWSFITGIPGYVGNALASFGTALYNIGYGAIKSMWDGLKSAWNWLADKATFDLPSINIPMVGTIGGGTIHLLPHLATGGVATESGLAVVGERGAEVVRLPRGAEVYPNGSMPADMVGQQPASPHITNHFHGITDVHELARTSARETAWALKTMAVV